MAHKQYQQLHQLKLRRKGVIQARTRTRALRRIVEAHLDSGPTIDDELPPVEYYDSITLKIERRANAISQALMHVATIIQGMLAELSWVIMPQNVTTCNNKPLQLHVCSH